MEAYESFEYEFGQWAGVPNVVACSSGTAAIHLALESLGYGGKSVDILIPDFTMVACARAATLAGMTPVFVDCNDDLTMNVQEAEKLITKRTVAIMPVHIYGRRCDMESITTLAMKYNLDIVEDLAEAHGVSPSPITKAACWSFYKNKIIAGEEGGAVAFPRDTLNSQTLAKRARQLRSLGFTDEHDFTHIPRGHNYRMSNLHANAIRASLIIATDLVFKRFIRENKCEELCPKECKMPWRDAHWVYDFKVPANKQQEVVRALQVEGIAARHGFKPMSSLQEYKQAGFEKTNAYRLSQEIVYIPLDGSFDIEKAFSIVRKVLEK